MSSHSTNSSNLLQVHKPSKRIRIIIPEYLYQIRDDVFKNGDLFSKCCEYLRLNDILCSIILISQYYFKYFGNNSSPIYRIKSYKKICNFEFGNALKLFSMKDPHDLIKYIFVDKKMQFRHFLDFKNMSKYVDF